MASNRYWDSLFEEALAKENARDALWKASGRRARLRRCARSGPYTPHYELMWRESEHVSHGMALNAKTPEDARREAANHLWIAEGDVRWEEED